MYGFHDIKPLLVAFWSRLNDLHQQDDIIKLLKEYSEIKIYVKNSFKPPKVIRASFHREKRHKRLFGQPCIVCKSKASQRHHIIQVQHGGRNDKRNVVPICKDCHCKIHPWLNK